jgi:hypothetical protein
MQETQMLTVLKNRQRFPVKVQISDFSKGVVKKDKNVCSKCLEAVDEAYLRHEREGVDEERWIHEHEN